MDERTPLFSSPAVHSNGAINESSNLGGTIVVVSPFSSPFTSPFSSPVTGKNIYNLDGNEECHLPEIPEGRQSLLGRYDDRNHRSGGDDDDSSGPPASVLHNLDLLSECDVPVTPSSHRRTYSIDLIEDAVELLHNVTEIVTETVVEVKEEIIEIIEEEVAIPIKPREEGDHSTKLSAVALAVLVFYKVSGGPFGCEPAVKCAGPFYALLGFALFPLLWCIQEALVTAELGSAYPEPSGSVAWIEEAFGPKAGLMCGYFHWVAGATDNAIYPSLFLQYLAQYISSGDDKMFSSDLVRFVFTIIISAVLALINYSGLEIVGTVSMVVCVISMSPFLILCIVGVPKIDPQRWLVMPDTNATIFLDDDEINSSSNTFLPDLTYGGVMWRPFINTLFWNLNSFDVGASFAGEVHDAEHVFPKAMFLSVLFVVVGYLIPLLVSIGATESHQSQWDAGFFTQVSNEIAGPWLAGWTVLAAAVSNIGLFEAEMSGDAYQLMGMADRGLIPKIFSKRSRFGTPTYGILVGTFVIFCLGVADFDALVEMLNFAYSISLLMEFAAFIKLRIADNDVIRPYRIPLNTLGCILFITPSCLICLFVMASATKTTFVYFVVLLSFGISFHFLQKLGKHYNWFEYAVAPPKKASSGKRTPTATSSTPGSSPFTTNSKSDDNNKITA